MSGSEPGALRKQIDTLQEHVESLKRSADQALRETREQVEARISQAKADMDARGDAVREKAGQVAERPRNQWEVAKAEVSAKMRDLQDRIDRKREQHDVKEAEAEAEVAEADGCAA